MTKTTETIKDPICGMPVDAASAIHAERDGKTYYFCSDICRDTFQSASAGAKADEKHGGCCG
ncbi:MAG: YHS domain-containing protein [Planctomycetota bacterium]